MFEACGYGEKVKRVEVSIFSMATLLFFYRHPYLIRMRITPSDKHAGMTLDEIAAQAAIFAECELTKFSFSCIRFGVHPSALRLYEGI